MTDPQIKCRYNGHQDEDVKAVCIEQNCTEQRTICFTCMQEDRHRSHPKEILKFPQFIIWKTEGIKIIDTIRQVISNLDVVTKLFKDFIQEHQFIHNQELEGLNTLQLNLLINQINVIKKIDINLSSEIKHLDVQLQQIRKKFKELKSDREKCQQTQNDQLTTKNQQQFPEQQQGLTQSTQLYKGPIITEQVKFRFSKKDKYENFQVQQDGKVVQTPVLLGFQTIYAICLCEQNVSYGNHRVAFQIKRISSKIFFGLCSKDSIEKKGYRFDIQNIINGLYLLSSDGYYYSHKNTPQQSQMQFKQNDIIIVDINQTTQILTWIKKQTNEQFQIKLKEIPTDLFPCIGFDLQMILGQNIVEIIDI